MMETYKTGTGQHLWVHKEGECRGEFCVIHNPSQHALAGAPTHWRFDRGLMERVCIHGVGHPDPDHLAHSNDEDEGVHGCDGCCS